MFVEPGRTSFDVNFTLFGFPVRIHPMFWLVTVFLSGSREARLPDIIAWVLAVGLSILIHELGHAVAMRQFGILSYIVLYSFGGVTVPAGIYGGYRRTSPLQQIMISAAGPLTNIALAFLIAWLFRVGGSHVVFSGPPWFQPWVLGLERPQLQQFLNFFFFVSVFWAYVNLLPIYPLDGGQIARALFVAVAPARGIGFSLMLSIAAATGMAVFGVMSGSIYTGIFFGYLAFSSYQMLQGDRRNGGW